MLVTWSLKWDIYCIEINFYGRCYVLFMMECWYNICPIWSLTWTTCMPLMSECPIRCHGQDPATNVCREWGKSPSFGYMANIDILCWYTVPDKIQFVYSALRDDVIKWKHFPRYWPFVRGIHRSPVNSPHKSQWRGALMFSLIYTWIRGWVNNREAGDLRRKYIKLIHIVCIVSIA